MSSSLGMQRGVDCAMGVVEEERLVGIGGLDLADHPDRPVGEVIGEVVVVGVLVGGDDRVALVPSGADGGSW